MLRRVWRGGRSQGRRSSLTTRRVRKICFAACWEIFPCPRATSIGGILGGLGPRSPAPYAEEAAEAQSVPPRKPAAPKTQDQSIAEELVLIPALATVNRQRIHRELAKKNHQGRFGPAQRTCAARRMSITNMLIDEQMRQSRPSR